MSFEKLDNKSKRIDGERSCVILYNFNDKEKKIIKNYGNIFGVKDQINISWKNGESVISDLVDDKLDESSETIKNEKAIIFNNVSSVKVNLFIDSLKKSRINNVLFAIVTETSKNWTINILIENLILERISMKKGKELKH
ncbi:MAG: DUF3783 domain-containing protein [Clostridium perfringens]|nr:DUF3783 domain-containing protein [Clostridium perfringens]